MACNSFATRILPIFCVIKSNKITLSSPRSWGCFSIDFEVIDCELVFPTLVGVFLKFVKTHPDAVSLPHARGGVSSPKLKPCPHCGSSPRSWGCFYHYTKKAGCPAVFPTLVGVFLWACIAFAGGCRLPHARGGVSQKRPRWAACCGSSPRSWGCFHGRHLTKLTGGVFPTLVGVFLYALMNSPVSEGLPHARGGVSYLSPPQPSAT